MGSLDSRNRHCLYRRYRHDHEEERCYKHDQQQYHQLAYFSSPSSLIHRKALGNIFLGHNHPSNNNNERNNNDNNKSNNKYNNKTTKATSSSSRDNSNDYQRDQFKSKLLKMCLTKRNALIY